MNTKRSSLLFGCCLAILLLAGILQAKWRNHAAAVAVTQNPSQAEQRTANQEPVLTHSDPLIPPAIVPKNLLPHKDSHGQVTPVVFLSPFEHDAQAVFHAHGEKVCASGCAASNHPTPELAVQMFKDLMQEFSTEPISEQSLALEALLYYGKQTQDLIANYGASPLDDRREQFLLNELTKNHAKISIRLVDEFGNVRASNVPAAVPFNRRHVFTMEGSNLQPLVSSGTVKRVGLYHIWTRL